ncbi:hypothetical protein Golomagni_01514 [Golovinomyces magnicellulatus]|nr:hypothetical protein Golomagni_01514 [Golovinomyces magnicellulatus]
MSLKSYSGTDDGVKTPGTLTESEEKIQLNDKNIAGSATQTIPLVEPVLECPRMFVWCLYCAVLICIEHPVGHKLETIILSEPVCLNCIVLKNEKQKTGATLTRSKIIDAVHISTYISMKCLTKCSAFDKASSLTPNLCTLATFSKNGCIMLYQVPINKLHNLCDEKCKLRTVMTIDNREENFENFMVAGFL